MFEVNILGVRGARGALVSMLAAALVAVAACGGGTAAAGDPDDASVSMSSVSDGSAPGSGGSGSAAGSVATAARYPNYARFPVGATTYGGETNFDRAAAAGLNTLRMDLPTAAMIESARGRGIEILPVAMRGAADLSAAKNKDHPPTTANNAAWAKRMIDMYRNMANPPAVIEVWNEPYVAQFWKGQPNAAEYLEMVKAFAKEAWAWRSDTTLLVSMDTRNGFRKALLAADTGKLLADPRILPTVHAYSEARSPTTSPDACDYQVQQFRCAYRDLKAHGHPDPQVWVTEFGWESNTPGGVAKYGAVSEAVQSDWTVQALQIFRASGMVAAAYVYMFTNNDGWSYNMLRPDMSSKPVVAGVKSYIASLPR